MSTGLSLTKVCGVVVLSVAVLCAVSASAIDGAQTQTHTHKKTTKKPPAATLSSGPTGQAVPQMSLESIAAVPPQVSFANNQLTIVAPNSTLADILKAVKKQTGAEIDVPAAPDRVVTHLGPGPARDIIADLLNGSRFNYVLLGSPADDSVLTRVVLVAKSGPENNAPAPAVEAASPEQAAAQPGDAAQPEQDAAQDADADQPADENNTDEADQQAAAEADQQQQQQDQQQGVKTPQQMLQEMQQRQMQVQQQQQQPGQPVNPNLAPRGPQQQ